jgi:hypothetical protein
VGTAARGRGRCRGRYLHPARLHDLVSSCTDSADLLLHHDLALRSSSTPRPPRRQQAASLGRYLSSQSWRETDAAPRSRLQGLDNRIDSGGRQPLPVALRLHVRPTCRPRTQSMRTRRAAGARCHGDSVVRRFYLLGCSCIVHYSWLL